jgi:hypothetical protein
MKDFSFQGRIELGTRLAGGKPGNLRWVGDATSCNLAFATENEDRTETFSGQRLQSARMRTSTSVNLSLVLRYATPANLQLGLFATANNVAGAAVVDEPLPAGLVPGDRLVLGKPSGITLLSLKDSEDPAATVDPDDYTLENAAGGIVAINSVAGYVQPLLASYTHEQFTRMPMFSAQPPERYFYLHGVDTISGKPVRVALYRVQFNPISELALLNDTFGEITLEGTALYDAEAALDATFGGFGYMDLAPES